MTWQELAEEIAKMSPEDRSKPVIFREPYDDAVNFTVTAVTIAREELPDENGENPIAEGEYFLEV